ncbi:flavodoxin domain-containing protein [Marinobacter lutaoensis]|jgi:flavodoxin|uniref:Flavodoxin n=1 Tax=Marinobacter lutaoensis TaxID=135739 RepID=A0A1V2DSA0_9GAMM|nr:flavodoxin domain-containing protein [Marinobacter lutaoensis]MBI43135.1 flavodoxin [Oceanospirillales bacterium]NVD36914.1 flavodoxin domain-containing protein [Marinobacter lutaoensis]ONF43512.1 flavodoxin [Marinobacter lutaoensis]|tara:strand:- start:4113 stop:4559 length:447 start_codon:yes stop_codon:yes gene_type:complete
MTRLRILVGSVYGGALLTARAIKTDLEADGHQVTVLEAPKLDDLLDNDDALLVCTSTTGQGEIPPNLLPFYLDLRERLPSLAGRTFGVIVLGDSSYGDTFCGAGNLMEEALLEAGASQSGDTLRIDALETLEPETEAVPWARTWLAQL